MGFTTFALQKIADAVLGGASLGAPTTWEFFPVTAIASELTGSYTAASGVSAVTITNNSTNFPNATGTSTVTKSNGTQIQTANFGSEQTIVGFALKDQANSNVWVVETLTTNITIASGSPFTIAAGQLSISTNSGTTYANTRILDAIFGGATLTVPSTYYWAPVTAITDAAAGTGTEVGSLARVAVTNNSTNFPNATGSSTVNKPNGTELSTGNAPSNYTAVGYGLWDASTSGNAWFMRALASNRAVTLGNPFRIAVGDLDWNQTNT